MRDQTLARRDFLELAVAALGAATLTCTGFTTLAHATDSVAQPQIPCTPSVPVGSRLLVAYATRCGSTGEIATAVGKDLTDRGYSVDVLPAEKVSSIAGYNAALVGSAVRQGNWLSEAVSLLRRYQRELQALPTAFFTVHLRNTGADESSVKARMAYLDPVRKIVRPNVEAYFAGKLDTSRLGMGARLMCKIMSAESQDRRDWPRIHQWGQSVFCAASR